MGQINLGRVILGGLLAGVILNVGEAALHGGILAEEARAALTALKPGFQEHPMYMAMLVALTFVQGVMAVWLYAAIRPRFGPGPKTAVCAGLLVWFFSAVYAAVYLHAGTAELFPAKIVWLPVGWELVEFPLATVAGAWLYKE